MTQTTKSPIFSKEQLLKCPFKKSLTVGIIEFNIETGEARGKEYQLIEVPCGYCASVWKDELRPCMK